MFDLKDQQHIESMAATILAAILSSSDPGFNAAKQAVDRAFEIRRLVTERLSEGQEPCPF